MTKGKCAGITPPLINKRIYAMSQQFINYLVLFIESDGINNQQAAGTRFIKAVHRTSVIILRTDPLVRFPCREKSGLKHFSAQVKIIVNAHFTLHPFNI